MKKLIMPNKVKLTLFILFITHLLIYLIKPVIYFSIISLIIYLLTPIVILFLINDLKSKKIKFLLFVISLPLIVVFIMLSFLYDFGYAKFSDTNCGENIKIAQQNNGLLGANNYIVEKQLNGVFYVIKNISSDTVSNRSNYYSQVSLKQNKKNFYRQNEFEFYSKCLPGVGTICSEFFIISEDKNTC